MAHRPIPPHSRSRLLMAAELCRPSRAPAPRQREGRQGCRRRSAGDGTSVCNRGQLLNQDLVLPLPPWVLQPGADRAQTSPSCALLGVTATSVPQAPRLSLSSHINVLNFEKALPGSLSFGLTLFNICPPLTSLFLIFRLCLFKIRPCISGGFLFRQ